MRSTIDAAGRLVVPKAIRDQLQLAGGAAIEITERGGAIEIVPVPATVEVVDGPDGAVLVPVDPLPPLTNDDVLATIDRSRA